MKYTCTKRRPNSSTAHGYVRRGRSQGFGGPAALNRMCSPARCLVMGGKVIDTPPCLFFSLVIIYGKCTGVRDNDFTAGGFKRNLYRVGQNCGPTLRLY
jgi:hypothetical protein